MPEDPRKDGQFKNALRFKGTLVYVREEEEGYNNHNIQLMKINFC
jgi:hypothetical protein